MNRYIPTITVNTTTDTCCLTSTCSCYCSAIDNHTFSRICVISTSDTCTARCSFGIYLFHQLFINVLLKVLNWYPLRNLAALSLLGLFAVVVLVSFAVTFLLRKIRWVRKYIL